MTLDYSVLSKEDILEKCLPCPFCGEQPRIDILEFCVQIYCIDHVKQETNYGDEDLQDAAIELAVKRWNRRK